MNECNHQFVRTGAMLPNESRCIHCGEWKYKLTSPAPDVQPVAWQYKKDDGKLCVSVHSPEAIEQWNDNIKWSKPLYTQPTSKDVHELLEALRAICGDDVRRVSVELHEKARAALAKWEGK